jgi:D-xylose transport system permease protein
MNKIKKIVGKNAQQYIIIMALIAIAIAFSILTKGIFVLPRNISMLARQTTVVGIIAIGMLFVIVAGHIDLSVGQCLGCLGTIAAALQVWGSWGTIPTVIFVLVIGGLFGAFNGYWIAFRNVPAFIATLGSMLILQGAKLGIGKGMAIAPMNDGFKAMGQAYVPYGTSWIISILAAAVLSYTIIHGRKSKDQYGIKQPVIKIDILKCAILSLLILGLNLVFCQYKGIPVPVLILIILGVFFNFVANTTTYGRSVYAIGGNGEASMLAGIKTKKIVMEIFIINGILAAAAGMILTARLNSATAAAGDGMELDAIASCVIGGVSMTGGSGKIAGALIGALIMVSLDNGMSLMNVQAFWQYIVKGIVLILAVWLDMSMNKSKN